VVGHSELQARAQQVAELWVEQGRQRSIPGGAAVQEYKAVNARESAALAEAFVSTAFLSGQLQQLRRKGRHRSLAGLVLRAMLLTRPVWARWL